MTRLVKCDRCGKEARDPYRGVPVEERGELMARYYEFVHLNIEANEDADHGDFCSWQCLAEWAMSKAMEVTVP
jgi:hypothetical protein